VDCFCLNLRHFSRAICQIYDRHLAYAQIQTGQFGILKLLIDGDKTVSDLKELLALDQTTMTRNLQVVARRGWVQSERSESDRRMVYWQLTPDGRAVYYKALPCWQQAQQTVIQTLHNVAPLPEWLPDLTRLVSTV
jgi:DNA-binding MarR family transcriptional regulator